MIADRQSTARAAADSLLSQRRSLAQTAAVVGLDGFVDTIIRPVRSRDASRPNEFERMEKLSELARRIDAAAGRSANLELVVERVKAGGNGVLMAGALIALGAPVDYIGNLAPEAQPGAPGAAAPATHALTLHPVYRDFASRCRHVFNLGPTGLTDALEFDDGKLMLGKLAGLSCVNWDNILTTVGGAVPLIDLISQSRLFALTNWRALSGMTRIWRGLAEEILPRVAPDKRPRIFIDLADPTERTDADLLAALDQLRAMQRSAPVTLGLNTAESARIATALSAPHSLASGEPTPDRLEQATASIRERLGINCVVSHNRKACGAATADSSASFLGPFVCKPTISTGAGDHFNAGFAIAQTLDLPLAECLAIGAGVSGWYVRNAEAPSCDDLANFLRTLPAPEAV